MAAHLTADGKVSHRLERVGELIHHQLGEIFLTEVEFPRNCLVTITLVQVSKDLRHATVWVSVLPGMYTGKALEALKKAAGHIQFVLNKKLSMKPLPRVLFKIDDTERKASVVEQAINRLGDDQEV
jgi:ribosome-binding factor A